MCTYNGEKYIIEQLDSLKNQTQVIDEVIICDDCSTDRTVEIIRNYIDSNRLGDSWNCYVNQTNKGYADNFHDVLIRATGDIIFFCDQDDIWHLDKVKCMVIAMEENNEIGLLVTSHHNFFGNEVTYVHKSVIENKKPEKVELSQDSIYLKAPGCTMAMRASFRNQAKEYWYSGFAHDEYAWKIGLCLDCVWFYDVCLMERRCHENNTSMCKMRTKEKRKIYIDNLEHSYRTMISCLEKIQTSKELHYRLIAHNLQACNMRKQLLLQHKLINIIPLLLWYRDTVKTPKSFFVEAYFAFRRSNK